MKIKKTIGVTVDPDLLDWLTREAKERRASVSQVIRELIVDKMRLTGALKSPSTGSDSL